MKSVSEKNGEKKKKETFPSGTSLEDSIELDLDVRRKKS